jgi:hypothetical protein
MTQSLSTRLPESPPLTDSPAHTHFCPRFRRNQWVQIVRSGVSTYEPVPTLRQADFELIMMDGNGINGASFEVRCRVRNDG